MNTQSLSLVDSAPLPYLLSVPSAAASLEDGWPILYFLHGYDEAAPLAIHRALTRHGPLRPGNAKIAVEAFIVIAPQLPTSGDIWRRYAGDVRHLVERVQGQYGGNPEQQYLTGFSFGGNGVFDLSLKQRDLWAALWAVDPTRVPAADPGCPVWLSSGEVSRRRNTGFMEQQSLALLGYGPAPDRVYFDAGLDHIGTAKVAYQDEQIYRWLLSKRLPAAV
jgi:hypothetical protein